MTEKIDPAVVGRESGGSFRYGWREAALYALAVGVGRDEPEYYHEKQLHMLPCFAVLPYWGTFGWQPPRDLPAPLPMQLGLDKMRSLHMAHRLLLHRPLSPQGESFAMQERLTDLFDHHGRGVVLRSEQTALDAQGRPMFTNTGDVLFRGYGGGTAPYQHMYAPLPEREPDAETALHIDERQHLLYRLCGDTNPGHVDDALMRSYGRKGAIMPGLCTLGAACHALSRLLWPEREQRLTMEARVRELGGELRGIVYPGDELRLRMWRLDESSVGFELRNEDGECVLDRALWRWE